EADLYQKQIAHAEMKAPMKGTVVSDDLSKQIGAKVKVGDTLFEVAPLDALRAELQVPEDRIADMQVGFTGELASASNPGHYLPFTVERINPVAEVVNQHNIFKVRVRLDIPPQTFEEARYLRPGVEGVAKVDVGRKSYALIWTR